MRLAWQEWKSFWDNGRVSPYVHWRLSHEAFASEGELTAFEFRNEERHTEIFKLFAPVFEKHASGSGNNPFSATAAADEPVARGMGQAVESLVSRYGDLKDAALILPSSARNQDFTDLDWIPDQERLPDPPPADAVIVGVIDNGIALGHRRMQFADGTTRVLAAWQQSASVRAGQPYLPFGSELYSQDIDELLRQNRPIGVDGPFDEEAFNRAAGLVEMRELNGHRELEMRAAHGAHVADIAAGFDPTQEDEETLRKMPIIAVNLPSRELVGLSGSFLEFFVILAIGRIADLSDALYERARQSGGHEEGAKKRGYRVLINLSFGMNAGSRDGKSTFHKFLAALNSDREKKGFRKIEVVMPAGNDNLERGQALGRMQDKGELELSWRVLPEDRTSNYLEIWSDELEPVSGGNVAEQLEIKVTPPGQPSLDFVAGKHGMAVDLGDGVARVYCLEKELNSAASRVQYVVCTSPTYPTARWSTAAPAGLWRIAVRNRSGKKKRVFFSIQTDQSALPSAKTGLRSYFEDPAYERFDETGRLLDSFDYSPGEKPRYRDKGRLVKRHGSLNALAHYGGVAVIGGYRLSDGRPADYSGTGTGERRFGDESRGAPTCALPTDDGSAHFGLLGSGSRDGSTVRLRGTSFATAQATRHITLSLLGGQAPRERTANKILFLDSKRDDPEQRTEVDIEKVGAGRLKPPDTGYLGRIGETWRGRPVK